MSQSSLSVLRTKGIIINLGNEKFIIRKATEHELAEHEKVEDPNQLAMAIDKDSFKIPASYPGD
jgi:hypothetical protein